MVRLLPIALAALAYVGILARPNLHVVLAATHDGEWVDLLADCHSVFRFGDAVGADGLIFDHRLRPGPASTRNAIGLLRLHGAPAELIRDAPACAERLDAQRGASLQARVKACPESV